MSKIVIPTIVKQFDFNLSYSKKLVEDLTEEQMTITPSVGLENHPSFTIGHLASGKAMLAEDLGAKYEFPEGWTELFQRNGPGDPKLPDTDLRKYPSKQMLVNELEHQHNKVKKLLEEISEEKLQENIKWRYSSYMPRILDLVTFMCITHEAMHLGQLAAWRRALNLHSALGAL